MDHRSSESVAPFVGDFANLSGFCKPYLTVCSIFQVVAALCGGFQMSLRASFENRFAVPPQAALAGNRPKAGLQLSRPSLQRDFQNTLLAQ